MLVKLHGKSTQTFSTVDFNSYYSMRKLYVEGGQNKNNNTTNVDNMTMWLPRSLTGSDTTSPLFTGQTQIDVENGFLELSYDNLRAPTEHANYQREVVIFVSLQ